MKREASSEQSLRPSQVLQVDHCGKCLMTQLDATTTTGNNIMVTSVSPMATNHAAGTILDLNPSSFADSSTYNEQQPLAIFEGLSVTISNSAAPTNTSITSVPIRRPIHDPLTPQGPLLPQISLFRMRPEAMPISISAARKLQADGGAATRQPEQPGGKGDATTESPAGDIANYNTRAILFIKAA